MSKTSAATILPHYAGLFSLINKVITCQFLYGQVYVNWSGGTIYSPPGVDLWAELFNGLREKPKREAVEIESYPNQALTYKNVAKHYISPHQSWRALCNRYWRALCLRPDIAMEASLFALDNFKDCDTISVLVRAHSHAGEQISDKSQSLNCYERAIDLELRPGSKIFLACGDEETIAWFNEKYVGMVVTNPKTKRAATRDTDRHLAEPQTVEDARQAIIDVLLLARARVMIHPVSNMATAALYISPGLKSVFLP